MKKACAMFHRLAVSALLFLCLAAAVLLSSCGEDITFNTLKPAYDESGTAILRTEVAPPVTDFSFLTELTCGRGVTYVISGDPYGSAYATYEAGVVPLSYGDNIVYLIVKKDGNVIENHTVNVYRKRYVEVAFVSAESTGGYTTVEEQSVTEGDRLTPPEAPERPGYDFLGWSVSVTNKNGSWVDTAVPYDFSYPLAEEDIHTGGTSLDDLYYQARFNAIWQARTDTPYKVEHYAEDTSGKYNLALTEEFTGKTDSTVSAKYKEWGAQHLEANPTYYLTKTSAKIAGDGTTVLKLYYSLERVTLGVQYEGMGTLTKSGEYRYGADEVAVTATPTEGFILDGWYDENGEKVSSETTYTYKCRENITARFVPDPDYDASASFILDGTTVTGVKNTSATALVIPDGVTAIAKDAFKGCYNLRAVYIPDSVTSVANDAFNGCSVYLVAYCEAKREPTTWDYYWDRCYYDTYFYDESRYIKSQWNVSFE